MELRHLLLNKLPTIKTMEYNRCKSKKRLFKRLFCQNLCFRERIAQHIHMYDAEYFNYRGGDIVKNINKLLNEKQMPMIHKYVKLDNNESTCFYKKILEKISTLTFKNIKYYENFIRDFKAIYDISHYDLNLALNNIDKYNNDVIFQRIHLCWVFKTAKQNGNLKYIKYMDKNISNRIILDTFSFKKFDPIISINEHYCSHYKSSRPELKSDGKKVTISLSFD